MTRQQQVVLIARHAEREDYTALNLGTNWTASAAEPWNTPLTRKGVEQAHALGRAIRRHSAALGLPPVTHVLSSPLLRCVQTAVGALDAMQEPILANTEAAGSPMAEGGHSSGVAPVGAANGSVTDATTRPARRIPCTVALEPALIEQRCEDWYRSWAVPGANSTWGGPKSCRKEPLSRRERVRRRQLAAGHVCVPMESINPVTLHPQAKLDARGDWLCSTADAMRETLLSPTGWPHGVRPGAAAASELVDTTYEPVVVAAPPRACSAPSNMPPLCWGSFESDSQLAERLGAVLERAGALGAGGATLLVSHGSPCATMARQALRGVAPPQGWVSMKYTALTVLVRDVNSAVEGAESAKATALTERRTATDEWRALLLGDCAHLAEVSGGACTGGSDRAEQGI